MPMLQIRYFPEKAKDVCLPRNKTAKLIDQLNANVIFRNTNISSKNQDFTCKSGHRHRHCTIGSSMNFRLIFWESVIS